MFESFLVTFRESLEAALIVGIVLAFLNQYKMQKHNFVVWIAVASAIVLSFLFAYLFSFVEGGFSGLYEELFEGATMLLAAGFLSYMILWLHQQKSFKERLKQKLFGEKDQVHRMSLFFLVLFAVLREGVETVLFLKAISFNSGQLPLVGGFVGIFFALLIGYFIFVLEVKLPIKRFFQVTSFFLILFAAGLLAHGVHELQEAGIIPIVVEHLYDMNSIFNEKGAVGQFAKGVFGYNGNPSLIEVLSYLLYLVGAFWFFSKKSR